jgi:hypothetical protein
MRLMNRLVLSASRKASVSSSTKKGALEVIAMAY